MLEFTFSTVLMLQHCSAATFDHCRVENIGGSTSRQRRAFHLVEKLYFDLLLKKIGAFSASLRLVIVGFVMLMVTSVVEVVVSA
mmetsp:Transcript_1882/g.2927  ORF Transcript_1882/g.2927 Transcript_1882/m.2927 type:complete len:84 (+) Transcript_1882:346-597(+)